MSVKLKEITDKSWLVLGDAEEYKIGLLTQIKDQYTLTIRGQKQNFYNKKELNKYFKEDVFSKPAEAFSQEAIKKEYFINGYPINFDNPIEVTREDTKLPLYSKKESSDVIYTAGYYCVNFPKNWMPSFCPKLATVQTYGCVGPFKTRNEMKSALIKLRKQKGRKI